MDPETDETTNASREAYQTLTRDSTIVSPSRLPAAVLHSNRTRGGWFRDWLRERPMTNVRRITVRVEHRELTLSLTQTVGPQVNRGAGAQPGTPAEKSRAPNPPVCPDCGAAWIDVIAQAGEDAVANAGYIVNALRQQGAHVHLSATGQFWFCGKSFEEIRFRKQQGKL